jgi:hypothetical protein
MQKKEERRKKWLDANRPSHGRTLAATALRANGSGQLPIGESIQGVCLQEDLSPFVEELATQ